VTAIEERGRNGQYAVKGGLLDRLTMLYSEENWIKTQLIGQTWKQVVLVQFRQPSFSGISLYLSFH